MTRSGARLRHPRKVRFNDEEWAVIVERARLCGRAPARYVRETALGAVPKSTRTQAIAPVVHELGRLGTQLRRLSDQLVANGASVHANEIDDVLGQILAAVRNLE